MRYVTKQLFPSAATEEDLYTVPTVAVSKIVSIFICNISATATSFRISHSVGGGATDNKDYRYYDIAIPGNDTFLMTTPIFGNTGDIIRVYATLGTLSFALEAQES
jgi:hypothetical protein